MTIYDFSVTDTAGGEKSLADYRGKVLLIVNTATGCGFTPQYKGLQELYEKHRQRGFEILDFPCNQFLHQAPGTDAEIGSFCTLHYGTTFPRFAKCRVNGAGAIPLYQWLKAQKSGIGGRGIKWNFTKFLVDRNGAAAGRFAPAAAPAALDAAIAKLLDEKEGA